MVRYGFFIKWEYLIIEGFMEHAIRPLVIIGNWKMHKTVDQAKQFVDALLTDLHPHGVVIGLAVPFTVIYPLAELARGSNLLIGGQNMNDSREGAFTGEIAGNMLKDAGAQFVILGHSERRRLYHEDDGMVNHKLVRAIESRLQPVLCVGETREERDEGKTFEVLERQLTEGLKNCTQSDLSSLIIAYEPVWAIGYSNSDHSATPETVEECHRHCREVLSRLFTDEFAHQVPIQYGGSVTAQNARDLLAQPNIDGLLIGGASLSLDSFKQIVNDTYTKLPLD